MTQADVKLMTSVTVSRVESVTTSCGEPIFLAGLEAENPPEGMPRHLIVGEGCPSDVYIGADLDLYLSTGPLGSGWYARWPWCVACGDREPACGRGRLCAVCSN